jgi:hypothetical protein
MDERMEFFFVAGVSMVVAMVAALVLDWVWPKASMRRLTVLAGSVPPLVTLVLFAILFAALIRSGNRPSPSPDAEGMALAALIMLTPFVLGLNLLFGLPAAHYTLRYLRAK